MGKLALTIEHNILVVDDSLPDQRLIEEAFNDCGHKCVLAFAANLEEARAQLAKTAFQLIILDMKLGHQNGLDLVREIRSKPRLAVIPIIALSGLQGNAALKAYQAGINSFIAKDADYKIFSGKIKVLMDFWVNVAELPRVDPLSPLASESAAQRHGRLTSLL